jgi:hypothetical protein
MLYLMHLHSLITKGLYRQGSKQEKEVQNMSEEMKMKRILPLDEGDDEEKIIKLILKGNYSYGRIFRLKI